VTTGAGSVGSVKIGSGSNYSFRTGAGLVRGRGMSRGNRRELFLLFLYRRTAWLI